MTEQSVSRPGVSLARRAARRAALPTPAAFAVACALAAVAALAAAVVIVKPDTLANDVWTYVAAGERLNAGHLLYALSPGDRALVPDPPYWTAPLMYPPLIAVLWRPLAAVSSDGSALVFWVMSALALLMGTVVLARRRRYAVAIAIAVLSYALALQVVVGNIDALMLLGFVVVWSTGSQRHERAVGFVVGLMTCIKLTPVFLVWWLAVSRRWTALSWAVAVTLLGLLVGVLGAGLSAQADYLQVLREAATAPPSPLSLAGIATQLFGLPRDVAGVIAPVISVGVVVAMLLLRNRPGTSFALAVFGGIYGSPAVWPSQLTRLLACLAPLTTAPAPLASRTTLAEEPTTRAGTEPGQLG